MPALGKDFALHDLDEERVLVFIGGNEPRPPVFFVRMHVLQYELCEVMVITFQESDLS